MMAGVVTRIKNLGVEVVHIPPAGGCTALCQPVDIGVNKPFKNRVRSEWQTWMINEGLQHGTTSALTRAHIIEWCHFAMNDLPAQMVRNAWRHAEYSWFPLLTLAAGDNDDDTESDDGSVSNAADNADNKLDYEEEELEENNESSSGDYFSTDSSVNEPPVDALPSTHNKKEEKDNESSDSDDESVPPLPSTHDFVAALGSNASNQQETRNKDSQLTTLSNQETRNEDSQLTTLSVL